MDHTVDYFGAIVKIIGLGESSWSSNDGELPRRLYNNENRDIGQAYTKIPNKIMGKLSRANMTS